MDMFYVVLHLTISIMIVWVRCKKVSEYDLETAQSRTADQPIEGKKQ